LRRKCQKLKAKIFKWTFLGLINGEKRWLMSRILERRSGRCLRGTRRKKNATTTTMRSKTSISAATMKEYADGKETKDRKEKKWSAVGQRTWRNRFKRC